MKRFLALLVFCLVLFASPAFAQSNTVKGTISAHGTGCSVVTQCVVMQIPVNAASATIQLSGTFTGTAQFEVSNDGINFYNQLAYPTPTTTAASSATAAGLWRLQVGSYTWLRVRASALAAGQIYVLLKTTQAPITY